MTVYVGGRPPQPSSRVFDSNPDSPSCSVQRRPVSKVVNEKRWTRTGLGSVTVAVDLAQLDRWQPTRIWIDLRRLVSLG